MATVRPFRGLRPKPELAKQVACPPYDVLSTREARAMAEGNPYSFLHVNKSEIDFDDSVNQYSREVYLRGRENLQKLIDQGVFVRDTKPCFYLYRLTWRGRSQAGLVALTSVAEYDDGIIKKHEHTRPDKVRDRADHIGILEAQVGPVFTAFRYQPGIEQIFARVRSSSPSFGFEADDGVTHELWVIDDSGTVGALIDAFARLDCMYIADGHHRSQSASEVCRRLKEKNAHHTGREPYNFFLNVLFPDRELRILPYNRVVKDLGGRTVSQVLGEAAPYFNVTGANGAVEPDRAHVFGAYGEGNWYRLEAKPGSFDTSHPIESIDASILANSLLAPQFGITDPKTDKRIDFVGGIRGTSELMKLVDSGEYKIAFSLYPTSIEQLLKVADAGEVMPPKSTWFEPKLRDGIVVNLLTE
ncbi:MAG: DUF1015 family protein [Candidatus Zixiibacteriota bacterium]